MNRIWPMFLTVLLVSAIFSACHRTQAPRATKRYPFTGRVVSIEAQDQSATIDGDTIPGFMTAMEMSYRIKPAETLKQLAPGDTISGEVVVVQPKNPDESPEDYWLENVKVTAHDKAPASKPAAMQRLPLPGDEVPDFAFLNQSGRQISFKQLRGKVVLVTFVYTRCPFADFCPRMSSNFAEIYRQMSSLHDLSEGTRLLTVSFDPEHDTPKILREYGFSVAHSRDAAIFKHWQFAVPRPEDLPKVAQFFGVVYQPDGGLITHNLSTTVIGPDGKIVKWYHGGDWQLSDLVKDATMALGEKG